MFEKTIQSILLFTFHILSSSAGVLFIKKAVTGRTSSVSSTVSALFSADFIIGMLFYSTGFLLWLYILSRYEMGVAVPIAQALFIVVSLVGAVVIFKETITVMQMLGIALCMGGIFLITLK